MADYRTVQKILKARPTMEGAGVHLKRVFGNQHVPDFDPFLLLDDFHGNEPSRYIRGFPWHPHRGMETITYMRLGTVEHGDSLGNSGVIRPGDVQWMTAGSGIIHQEMPKGEEDGSMWGFQLWANLPANSKMMDPRYQEFTSDEIPVVNLDSGVTVRVICGEIEGVEGPVSNVVISPEYLDVTVPPGAAFTHPVPKGHTVFAYITGGRGYFDRKRDSYSFDAEGANYFDMDRSCQFGSETLVHYGDGDTVEVTATDDELRFLLVSGKPIKEPVAWWGPVVMNSQEELRTAFQELDKGIFIKTGQGR